MSLAVLADHMASKGRGPDSMLIHMSPREVQGLQALAIKHGGSLTINPETGLPEAGFLDKLLPAIIGFGISAATGGAINPMQAAMIVGGVQTARTGDIGKGIQAGLGAYGGAGIGAGLSTAGESVLSGEATAAAAQSAANLAGEQATQLGLDEAAKQQMIDEASNATARVASNASPFERLSAGTKAFGENPMGFANKENFKYLGMAASPIIADMMVPTTTKQPGTQSNDTINQSIYDPYSGTYRRLNPVPAANYGTPAYKPFAEGGIVAMADGGVPGYADGMLVGDQQVFDYFKNLDQSKLGSGALDAQIAKDMQTYNVGAADIARITGTQAQQGDYEKRFVQQVAQPDTTASQFLAQTSDVGLKDQALANALQNSGLSAAAQYAATHSDVGTSGGLAGLSQNINTALTNPNLTMQQAQTEMNKYGLNDADVQRATGRSTAALFGDRDAAAKATADQAATISQAAANKAAADKAAADKAVADRIAAAIAADEKAAADRAAAAKAINDARLKTIADEDAAGRTKGAADKAAYEKFIADEAAAKTAADKGAREKAIADKAIADKAAAEKAIADKAAADKIAADKAAADKLAADAAAKAAADKALADGLSLAAAAAAADKARREAEAIAKAARDKAAADAAAAANKITSIGVVDLGTNTGVTQNKTDTTTLGTNTLATTTPKSIASNITTDGTYVGTTGETPPIGTKVGVGTIAGTGTEASTGTTGPIINYGGTSGFTVAPLTLAQTQIAQQAADLTAAQNKQLDLYRGFVTQNPNATDLEHANFMDKINLSPDVAARATPLSAQQMKNRYYDAKYNKQTGDSKAAYDYLMGKSPFPTKSGVGEIMRPYSEATLGMPASTNKKYIFDPITKSYKLNQDYVAGYKDSTGGTNYLMSPKEIYNYFVKNAGQADSVTYDWAIENNLTPEEIASATGVPLSTVAAKWRDAKAKKDSASKDATKTVAAGANTVAIGGTNYDTTDKTTQPPEDNNGQWTWSDATKKWVQIGKFAAGGIAGFAMGGMPMYAVGGGLGSLGSYSDGGRLLKGPGDGVSDSIPATIGAKGQPARLADGEFVVPARIVSELGNGSTEAGAKKLYAMMDRVQRARGKTTGKNRVAANSRADKYLPA